MPRARSVGDPANMPRSRPARRLVACIALVAVTAASTAGMASASSTDRDGDGLPVVNTP
jgi:hypothetical protein